MSNTASWLYSKESEQTYRPTLLFAVDFLQGATVGFTTPFNGRPPDMDDVGTLFLNRFYNASIASQQLAALQSSQGLGIDSYANISITLSDANCHWFSYQTSYGFGGAKMTVYFALHDPETDLFSPDYKIIFVGTCEPANYSKNLTTLTATSDYNLNAAIYPPLPLQRLCPLDFPSTFDERRYAADDPLSTFFYCGYSPDVNSASAAGNLGPGGPYTSCNKTKADCVTRGLYDQDHAGHFNRRFAASQWPPPATWKGNSYTQGKQIQGVNTENLSKYNQYAPITYGKTWVTGISANVCGDANSTRGEVILGSFWYNYAADWRGHIQYVVVNGLKTPHFSQTGDVLFRWYGQSEGSRVGFITQGVIYEGKGDPYGNLLMILPVVYQAVANSATPLDVKALLDHRPIPVWTAPGQWSYQRTDSIAWVLYDILRMAVPKLWARIRLQSVLDYDQVAANGILMHNPDGSSTIVGRYRVSLAITKEMTVAQIVEGLKLSGRVMIVPTPDGSELMFLCRQSVADQQSGPFPGSNDNTPYPSYRRTDDPNGSPSGTGYSAYTFNETNVILGSLECVAPPVQGLPTIITANIQDESNSYTPDTVSVGCVPAYNRIQRNNHTQLEAIGLPNYDQGYRAIETKFAEIWNGNPRNDFGGTEKVRFQTSFRGLHLHLGALIRLSYRKPALAAQWYRIEALSPSRDCQTITITAAFHNDQWYCDSFVTR